MLKIKDNVDLKGLEKFGFVINYHNIISKYVRMKNGKLREHFDRGRLVYE